MSGRLYVVGTPIGNLEDITYRAVRILGEVPIIACENTSRTRKLLTHFEIQKKKIIECSPANERNSAKGIGQFLAQGVDVALVSDAGTPSISDPGMFAVKTVAELGFEVIAVPGVSALTTIISVAGIGGENIIFTGFLSKKEGQIQKTLIQFADKNNVLVVFVSCHRIKKFLKTLKDLDDSADIIVGKELTKSFETIYRGSISDIEGQLKEEEKGEFVVVIKFLNPLSLEKIPIKIVKSKKEKRKQKL
ncbi:MAG: 16S rRNA (cytidine(1402)-2'-O)-methyltransferase [Brevinema sp.]